MSEEDAQEHFDDFFEDVFVELEDKYGEIEEMNVCDNLGDHLVGNVYVKVREIPVYLSEIEMSEIRRPHPQFTSFFLILTVSQRRGRRTGGE